IDIYGDNGNLDTNFGTTMVLRGRLVADAVVTAGSQVGGNPVGTYLPNITGPAFLTNIYGNADVDTIQFGDPTGLAGGTTWGDPGYIFIGSKTRVHAGGNEDQLKVFYLQDATVTTGPNTVTPADHTLTLDGQAATDYYTVYTLGSRGNPRNYVI